MHRDLDSLTGRTFDLLVIGGGIYGLTIACDAAQRGLSVALVERDDFGGGSSFNHLRTIHGGLRYLQTLDLVRARESIRERRTLAQIAPSYVRPVPFVLPLTRSLTRGRLALQAGLWLDSLIARDRNDGVAESHRLPAGVVIGGTEALRRYPQLEGIAMTGAAIWHDYVTTDADRLTFSWGLAAVNAGALLANYVEATTLTMNPAAAATTTRVIDRVAGTSFEIGARIVVNATGAAIDRLLGPAGAALGLPMLKAMNVVTGHAAPPAAFGGRGPDGRNLFLVPWRGRALFGTWESTRSASETDGSVDHREVERCVDEIRAAFPSFQVTPHDITLVHRGIVPAVADPGGSVHLDGGEHVHEHAATPQLISVAGTKYTTARAVAERVTDRIVQKLGRPASPCRTHCTLLPVSMLAGHALVRMSAATEMVVHLDDVVLRRTGLGSLGYPGDEAIGHAAAIVGDVQGWDDRRRSAEIERVRHFYDWDVP
jgi:glycerol-3-phosphate dehydrogenase